MLFKVCDAKRKYLERVKEQMTYIKADIMADKDLFEIGNKIQLELLLANDNKDSSRADRDDD